MAHLALPQGRLAEKLGLAFPLSAGLHGLAYFILAQLWNASPLWSAVIFAPFAFVCPLIKVHRDLRNWSWRDALVVIFVSLAALQVVVHIVVTPASEWDSVALWLLKGKAIAAEGKLTPELVSWLAREGLHSAYPWNVPMMIAWVARITGQFSETASKTIYAAHFCSLLLILYSLARLRWERTGALTLVAAYLAIPMVAEIAGYRNADMILETLIAAAIFLLLRHQIHPGRGTIILLAAMVLLCSWTKMEGLVFSGLVLLPGLYMLSVSSQRAVDKWLFTGALMGLVLGFLAFWLPKELFGATTWFSAGPIRVPGIPAALHRASGVARVMLNEMIEVPKWNLTWALPFALLWKGHDRYGLKFLFFAHVALYFAVYFFTPLDWVWQMRTSLSRVLVHTIPALFAWSAFAFSSEEARESQALAAGIGRE
ncbi:MAG TPA: hypothetical protein VGQ81_02670 [Acidobacteriota bacterium]|jgi:hypothetical protein|nr:hypothetical protein [Acidobacteriota bacterium]